MVDPNLQFQFIISPEDHGTRLDVFLAELDEPPLTRSQIKRRIDAGEVTVNDSSTKAGYALRADDVVVWNFEPDVPFTTDAQEIPIDILLENEHVAFVNKPAGMVVHPSPGHPDGTLVNALAFHFGKMGGSSTRPGIVHRIDKDTSGVLVVAKTDEAHRHLSQKFHDHDIQRTYHAIAWGPTLRDSGTFDTMHHRSPNNRLRYTGNLDKGRRAVTHYKVKEILDEHHKLVECWLETGRTHQIRMHFFEAGAPLIGDTLYGFKNTMESRFIGRQALHARSLGFEMDGEDILVSCPYPDDFADALEKLKP